MRLPACRTLPSRMFVTPSASAILRTSVFCPLNAKVQGVVERKTTIPSGSAGDHLQAGDLRQRIDDLFGEVVVEVVIVFSRTHIGERQDRNRRSSSSAVPNR